MQGIMKTGMLLLAFSCVVIFPSISEASSLMRIHGRSSKEDGAKKKNFDDRDTKDGPFAASNESLPFHNLNRALFANDYASSEGQATETVGVRHRSKRFLGSAIGIISGVMGIYDFVNGMFGEKEEQNNPQLQANYDLLQRSFRQLQSTHSLLQDTSSQLERTYGLIKNMFSNLTTELKSLNVKIDNLDSQLGEILRNQQLTSTTVLYGNDISRLKFLQQKMSDLKLLTNLNLGTAQNVSLVNLTYTPTEGDKEWAKEVLSLSDKGVQQIMHNMHDMMTGHHSVLQNKPIISILKERLNRTSGSYWTDVSKMKEFLFSLQQSGYLCWGVALVLAGRQSELENYKITAKQRVASQKDLMKQLLPEWPAGTYGLQDTVSGCPVETGQKWNVGYRHQDTENYNNGNSWPSGIHCEQTFLTKSGIQQNFCMKTDPSGKGTWPNGTYCIAKYKDCPAGFSSGYIYWDDQDTAVRNRNSKHGILPDGKFDQNTQIYYCCRSDGQHDSEIILPSEKPFYLFRNGPKCQKVKNMNVLPEWINWDNEDTNNWTETSGTIPDIEGTEDIKLFYCYYSM